MKDNSEETRTKAAALLQSWDERDERYRRLNRPMTEQEAAVVRAFRLAEANALSVPERWKLLERIIEWTPPAPPKGWRRGL